MATNGYHTILPPLDQPPPTFVRMDVSASVGAEGPLPYSCRYCDYETADLADWESHVFGQRHASALSNRPEKDKPEILSRTLYAAGAPLAATASRVFRYFSDFGTVYNVVAVREGDPSGFFFVEFDKRTDAKKAIEDRPFLDGLPLRVSFRRAANAVEEDDGGDLSRRLLAALKRPSHPMDQAPAIYRVVADREEEKGVLTGLMDVLQRWLDTFFHSKKYKFAFCRGTVSGFALKNSPIEIFVDNPGVTWEQMIVVMSAAVEDVKSCHLLEKVRDEEKPGVILRQTLPQNLGGDVQVAIWAKGMDIAMQETVLLQFYSSADLRLRYVVVCLLWWARRERLTAMGIDVCNPGMLEEVSFTWLILTALINRPCINNNRVDGEVVFLPTPTEILTYGYDSPVNIDVGVDDLFVKFFQFVHKTDFENVRVATGQGKLLTRGANESRPTMILEHPLDPKINLASGYSDAGLDRLKRKVADCLEVFAVCDRNWDISKNPRYDGKAIPKPLLTKRFPLLYLALGYPVASGIITQRGVPKRTLDANKTLKFTISLSMQKFCPLDEESAKDVDKAEVKVAQWCNAVRDTMRRLLADVLRYEVQDVTELGRPAPQDGVLSQQIDYASLLSKLGVNFSEKMVAKEIKEGKNDEVLNVFHVKAFWPTWERRKRIKEQILSKLEESGGTMSFFDLEQKVSDEIISEFKKEKRRGPSQDLPRSSFLVDVRRKKDHKILLVLTDVASRASTLKGIYCFLSKSFVKEAVTVMSAEFASGTGPVAEKGDANQDSDDEEAEGESEGKEEPQFERYQSLTSGSILEDDDDDVYDPAKVSARDVVKIDDEAFERELLANGKEVLPLSALFEDETPSPSIDGEMLGENKGQDDDAETVNPLAAVLAYASPSPTPSLAGDVEMLEEQVEIIEDYEEVDVYDADKQEKLPLSPQAAVRLLFDGDSDEDDDGDGHPYLTSVKYPHVFALAPKLGIKKLQIEAEKERIKKTYMQQAVVPQIPYYYGYRPAMPPAQRKILKLKGWNVEETVNQKLEQQKNQLVPGDEKTRNDSGSSASSLPSLRTPSPTESKRRKLDSESSEAAKEIVNGGTTAAAEGTFLGGFFQKRATENGVPFFNFLKDKPAELPLLTSPPKKTANGHMDVDGSSGTDVEIVEEIKPTVRRSSGDAVGDRPRRKTPPGTERALPFF